MDTDYTQQTILERMGNMSSFKDNVGKYDDNIANATDKNDRVKTWRDIPQEVYVGKFCPERIM